MNDVDYMEIAALAEALRSPDPSTQNGAILVDPSVTSSSTTGLIIAWSCNEFPVGVSYFDSRWERPIKYSFIEHAERNAIFLAARSGYATEGARMFCPWAACADCARAIIQAGLSELITFTPLGKDTNARWDDSINVAMTMLDESAVRVTFLEPDYIGKVRALRRDGKFWTPQRGVHSLEDAG